ncbi:protein RALF-like 22 [Solanum verrucosum]|uniref:protein RALF-like 22 n=1 Tax=Solanum verrucosum TaxID=315347 RepID=UPI0020D1D34D|nr:protein RALF-like 22 [Solanum verrucosum]
MMIDPSSSSSSSSLSSIMHGEDYRAISTRKCNGGLVGNCIDEEEEMMMESDISRRVLGGRNGYVSYGAMSRNNVPCNVRGASYYNCHANQRVNPYRRGCTQITRCARTNS